LKNSFADQINSNVYKQIMNNSINDAELIGNKINNLLGFMVLLVFLLMVVFLLILRYIHYLKIKYLKLVE
jgi:hypothetical protein